MQPNQIYTQYYWVRKQNNLQNKSYKTQEKRIGHSRPQNSGRISPLNPLQEVPVWERLNCGFPEVVAQVLEKVHASCPKTYS